MKKILALLMVMAIILAMPLMAFAEAPEALPQNPIPETPVLIEYGWEIFAGVIVLTIMVIAAIKFIKTPRKEQLEEVRKWLLQAVIAAEQIFGSKAGEAKLSFVYDLFVSRMPWLARIIPFSRFSEIVDDSLNDMEQLLQKKPDLIQPVEKIK